MRLVRNPAFPAIETPRPGEFAEVRVAKGWGRLGDQAFLKMILADDDGTVTLTARNLPGDPVRFDKPTRKPEERLVRFACVFGTKFDSLYCLHL